MIIFEKVSGKALLFNFVRLELKLESMPLGRLMFFNASVSSNVPHFR
jgi:hypothetical protein